MVVEDSTLAIRAGQRVAEHDNDSAGACVCELRHTNVSADGTVRADVRFNAPSQATAFATIH